MMSNIINESLDELLDEACLRAYPDPQFDKQYRVIDNAITDAAENYAEAIGQEHLGSSYTEADMLEIVRRMLDQKDKFAACLAYIHEFGPHFEDFKDRTITHQTERIHLVSENGKVTAEVIRTNRCKHGDDVFVPGT